MLRKIFALLRKISSRPSGPPEHSTESRDTSQGALEATLQEVTAEEHTAQHEIFSENFLPPTDTDMKAYRTTTAGINLIKHYESLRLEAYKPDPSEEYYTIGFGHYGPDVRRGDRITVEYAEALFQQDLLKFEKAVNKLVTARINQNQFNALVSFVYNFGETKFARSTLLKVVNADPDDKKEVREQFMRWVNSNGSPLPGLIRRREAEANLYCLPVLA